MIILLHQTNGDEFAINTDCIKSVIRERNYNGELYNFLIFKEERSSIKIKETPEQVVEITQKAEDGK